MRRLFLFPTAVLSLLLSLILTARQFPPASAPAPVFGYKVVHKYPHDHAAFIQGFIYLDGVFYESTGLSSDYTNAVTGQRGGSSLRMVEVETGKVLRKVDVPPQYFAEGLTDWKKSLIQLTW